MGWFRKKSESAPVEQAEQLQRAEAEVAEARQKAVAARMELQRWVERRPLVEREGRAMKEQMAQNHLSELLFSSMRGH